MHEYSCFLKPPGEPSKQKTGDGKGGRERRGACDEISAKGAGYFVSEGFRLMSL